jgi:phosphatidylserine/phosphatidylglycerophosphate/cardiolipin synthase-like enzyme
MDIALGAEQRLVVMTPFLDETGAELVRKMFLSASPEVEKTLIVRGGNAVTAPAGTMAAISKQAKVFVYMMAKDGGRYETFHSKAILADNRQAYVGSANMLNSSLSISLEMGFLVTGDAAAMLGRFIDSIITRLTPRYR